MPKKEPPSYITIVRMLTELIERDYPDGGRLPSSREMCKALGTTLSTYGKALDILRVNGLIHTTKGRGGTFANPRQFSHRKVGLLLGSGGDSPLLTSAYAFATLLGKLTEAGISVQCIQGSPETLDEKLALHNIQFLIAISPDPKFFPTLKAINRTTPVLVTSLPLNLQIPHAKDFPILNPDKEAYYRLIFKCMSERKHRSIMLVSPFMKHEYQCIRQSGEAFGLDIKNSHFVSPNGELKDFKERFSKLEPTILLVEGASKTHLTLSRFLTTLSQKAYPEVILHYAPAAPLYRQEKIAGILYDESQPLGARAAEMVVAFFARATPPESQTVNCSTLRP